MNRTLQREDTASQAGWMFADLFLALTVIFLATVSFVPIGISSGDQKPELNSVASNTNPLDKQSSVTLISNGFIAEYKSADFAKFQADFRKYLKVKDLPENTNVLFLEALGHTDATGAGNDSGNLAALKFLIEAKKLMPNNFDGASSSINLATDVPAGNVRIKVTLS